MSQGFAVPEADRIANPMPLAHKKQNSVVATPVEKEESASEHREEITVSGFQANND